MVIIQKDGVWHFEKEICTEKEGIEKIQHQKGIVFPVIHGAYGEDGVLQKILESHNIAYIGSGSEAMELTIDKQKTGDFLS